LRLFRGEVITQESDWFNLREARLQLRGYTEPHLPVAVASTITPSGTALAGKYGLDVLSLGGFLGQPVMTLAEQWAVAERSAQEHGQIVDRAGWRIVLPFYIAPTREEAVAQAREGCRRFLVDYVGGTVGHHVDEEEMEVTLSGEGTAIIGSPDDAIAHIERLQDMTGGFGGFVGLFHEWAGPQEMTRSYELFARYVMPHFQGLIDPLQRSQQWLASNNTKVFGLGPEVMRTAFQDAGVELPAALRAEPND
jgi:limonene 1,2-monooxygenase